MEQKPQDMGNKFLGLRKYIFEQNSFNLEKNRIMFTVSVFIYLLISQPFFFNLKFQVTGPVGVRRIYLYKIHHSTFCPGGSNPCRKQNKNQDR